MGRLLDAAQGLWNRVSGENRTETLLTLALAAGLLLATGSAGWVVATSGDGDTFTELSLLTENESGEIVADGYPTTMASGKATPLVVEIGNHERRAMTYTVVVELQRVANDTTTVRTERELRRFTSSVDANETRRKQLSLSPSLTGSRLRLVFLLYDGPTPAEPSIETADQEVHLWVDVTATV